MTFCVSNPTKVHAEMSVRPKKIRLTSVQTAVTYAGGVRSYSRLINCSASGTFSSFAFLLIGCVSGMSKSASGFPISFATTASNWIRSPNLYVSQQTTTGTASLVASIATDAVPARE